MRGVGAYGSGTLHIPLHFIKQTIDHEGLDDVTRGLNLKLPYREQSPSAVTVTTGMESSAGNFRCSARNCQPSITGIIMSSRNEIRMIVLLELVERLTPVARDGGAVPRGLEDVCY